jgi:hypothetical protein
VTRITVGEVDIRTDIALTVRQIRQLLMDAAGVAAALTAAPAVEETPERPALGFTAHLELDAERNAGEDLADWFEESP